MIATRPDPVGRYGLRLTLVAAALVLVAVPFATLTFNVVGEGPLVRWDGAVADALNRWVHDQAGLVGALEALSWLGRPPVLALWVAVGAAWCWRSGRHRLAVFLVATSVGGGVVDTLVKVAVDRPRPLVDHPVSHAYGKSFPSGHAMSSTVVYGALLLVLLPILAPRLRRPAALVTAGLVAAIGCSRLLLGVHFVTDVVGGYLLGAAWLAGAAAVFEAWRHEVPVRDTEPDEIGLPAG